MFGGAVRTKTDTKRRGFNIKLRDSLHGNTCVHNRIHRSTCVWRIAYSEEN